MISKNKIKLIKSLEFKKYRLRENLFLAEGKKLVIDILESDLIVETLFATAEFLATPITPAKKIPEIILVSEEELKSASFLQHPQQCMALCRIPKFELPDDFQKPQLIICLDNIQDPGNLGTIIRLADWFGIKHIVCSEDSADVYNPKVIQATMGAIGRVKVHYTKLNLFLEQARQNGMPVFGTYLEGVNIYKQKLPENAVIVFGNEGKGINTNLNQFITNKLHIPTFSDLPQKVESLNVSVAAAIICSEFKRQIL